MTKTLRADWVTRQSLERPVDLIDPIDLIDSAVNLVNLVNLVRRTEEDRQRPTSAAKGCVPWAGALRRRVSTSR